MHRHPSQDASNGLSARRSDGNRVISLQEAMQIVRGDAASLGEK